jgi:hypothetical protein
VGGIDNGDRSVGFDRVVMAPPQQLIDAAVNSSAPGPNVTTSAPLTWTSATKEAPKGTLALAWTLTNTPPEPERRTSGGGAPPRSGGGGGGSGSGVRLNVQVTVPANTVATTRIPLVGIDVAMATIVDAITASPVWVKGGYVAGTEGITGASYDTALGVVAIEHGSGGYAFELTHAAAKAAHSTER